MPAPDMSQIEKEHRARELQEELDRIEEAAEQDPEDKVAMMNQAQRAVFQEIINSVQNNSGRLFAIDAPGGTGKTFLLSTLLEQVRKSGKIAVATALTGIASILLPGMLFISYVILSNDSSIKYIYSSARWKDTTLKAQSPNRRQSA